MINIYNQTRLQENRLVATYNDRLDIYGTDGVLFAIDESTGDIYRALDVKSNMAGSSLSDVAKWAKTDLIKNQSLFNNDIGAIRKGIDLVTTDDMKLNVSEGHFIAYNSDIMAYDKFDISAINGATFNYIDKDGTVVDSGVTDIDPIHIYKDGAKTEITKSYHASFQKVYIDLSGNLKVIRGDIDYPSHDKATYRSIAEEIPMIDGLHYIGGFILKKSCATLDSNRNRTVYASKLGESQIGVPSGSISKLKEPVENLTDLKGIESPEDGEIRQELSTLPIITLWAFNATADSGEEADDGTVGYWNKLESSSKRKTESITADTIAEVDTDYTVDTSGGDVTISVTAPIDSLNVGKFFSVSKSTADKNIVSIEYAGASVYTLDIQSQSVEIIFTDTFPKIVSEYKPFEDDFQVIHDNTEVFYMPCDGDYKTYKNIIVNRGVYDKSNGKSMTFYSEPTWKQNGMYNLNSRDLILQQGISLSSWSFAFSFWVKVEVIKDSNYFFGNTEGGTAYKTLHIGWRDSDTFTLAFWSSDANWDNIKQSDYDDGLNHFYVIFNAGSKTSELFVNGVSKGQRSHSQKYQSDFRTIFSVKNSGNIAGVTLARVRLQRNTDFSKRQYYCDTLREWDKRRLFR
jgi:hypothetical protein